MTETFFLEPTNKVQLVLRRFTRAGGECSHMMNGGYHSAVVYLDQVEVPLTGDPEDLRLLETVTSCVTDGRWPRQCVCGYAFDDSVDKQYWPQRLYQRLDTGELTTLKDAPTGRHGFLHNGELIQC